MLPGFPELIAVIITLEGGPRYTNDPDDPGGGTKYGITEKKAQEHGFHAKDLTRLQAEQIYLTDYWIPSGARHLPYPLNFYVLDTAVNMGVDRAVKLFQRLAGVKEDGVFGPVTMAAAGRVDSLEYLCARRDRYLDITWGRTRSRLHPKVTEVKLAEAHRYGFKYIRGWLNRLDRLRNAVEVLRG
jgi:lysozyme family protein